MRVIGSHPHDERGASAVFFGLALVVLIAALGLSVDIGNVQYQQTRAQHAADAAARQVASACALSLTSAACMDYQATATSTAADSVEDATVTGHAPAGTSATVDVSKVVNTPLLGAIGITSKDVSATATANWNNYPIEGAPILPIGISRCTYLNHQPPAGVLEDPADRVNLRTDTLQNLSSTLNPLLASTYLLARSPLSAVTNQLIGTQATETCTASTGATITMLQGAIWLTGLAGVLGYSQSAECDIRIQYDVVTYASALASGLIPPTCRNRLGTTINVGDTILLPVYEPQSALASSLGLRTKTCATVSTALGAATINDVCLEVPPQIGVKIVGFAPFTVTGWTYPGNVNTDASVTCNSINAVVPVQGTLSSLLGPLGLIGSLAMTVLNTLVFNLLTNTANLPLAVGCNGIQGYFTHSFTKDPNFTYSPTGPNYGAQAVRLTN